MCTHLRAHRHKRTQAQMHTVCACRSFSRALFPRCCASPLIPPIFLASLLPSPSPFLPPPPLSPLSPNPLSFLSLFLWQGSGDNLTCTVIEFGWVTVEHCKAKMQQFVNEKQVVEDEDLDMFGD